MKRISLFLVFLVLVSCSKKDDVRAEGQFVNMKNPMVEVSEEGMKEKLGFYLILPAFAKEPKFFLLLVMRWLKLIFSGMRINALHG